MQHMVNGAVTYEAIGPGWKRLAEGIWNPSGHVKSLSLFAGYIAGEAYSVYVVFYTHALTPVSAYLTEQTPHLRAVSGKYREVFDLGGLLPLLVASLVAFALAWCVVRGIALALANSELSSPLPGRPVRSEDLARSREIAFNRY